jgi:glycosyltransferase involved in cell wall biosynthesis
MTPDASPTALRTRKTVILLFPEILRPLKLNHAHMFEVLSKSLCGYVLTMSSQTHQGVRLADFELYSGQLRSGSPLNGLVRLGIFVALPLWRLRRRGPIDVVVTYDPYGSGIPGLILKTLLGAKLIVQIMGDYHRLDPNDELLGEYGKLRKTGGAVKKFVMKIVFRLCVAAADAIKVLNRDQERFVRARWPKKRVYRFADFAATGYFGSLTTFEGDYLLAVGHPFHRKGVDVLIRAFARIADRHPHMHLRILGYAPKDELDSYRELAGHHPRIEFVQAGWIEAVGEQMRGCYAFVHAARSEAMGRVLLEAMACRKAVVSTRTNGGADYVVDGKTGTLCDIDDVEGLASAMDALLSAPELARRMGQAGFEHLSRESSEERFAELFSSMIDEVATPGSTGDGALHAPA